jgi:hypothetical protein
MLEEPLLMVRIEAVGESDGPPLVAARPELPFLERLTLRFLTVFLIVRTPDWTDE